MWRECRGWNQERRKGNVRDLPILMAHFPVGQSGLLSLKDHSKNSAFHKGEGWLYSGSKTKSSQESKQKPNVFPSGRGGVYPTPLAGAEHPGAIGWTCQ